MLQGMINRSERMRIWVAAVLLVAGMALSASTAGDPAGYEHARHSAGSCEPADPFEPTVTREENALLQQAMQQAESNPDAAITLLKEHGLAQASPALDFAVGNIFFQQDNLSAAAAAYRQALTKLPKFRSALTNLGRVYLLQERYADAIAQFQQLARDGQADGEMLMLLGHALLLEDYPASAEAAYRQSLMLRPESTDTRVGLAKALLQQERYAEGLALLEELLRKNPQNRELWSLRASASLALARYDDAITIIEAARRVECADSDLLATLGDLYLNRNQPADASAAYERAFAANRPSVSRLLHAIEGFLLAGRQAEAAQLIERADVLRNGDADAFSPAAETRLLRLKAQRAHQNGSRKTAIRYCRKVLERDPLAGDTLLLLAALYEDRGELEQAVMACERAARISGFEADALVRQARLEVSRERYSRAVDLLEAAQAFVDRPHVARYLRQLRRMVP